MVTTGKQIREELTNLYGGKPHQKAKWHIHSIFTMERVYEVEAKSEEEAKEIYFAFDDRTQLIKERGLGDDSILDFVEA